MSFFAVVYAHPKADRVQYAFPSTSQGFPVVRTSMWVPHWYITKNRKTAERRAAKLATVEPLLAQFLEVRELAA